MLPGHVPLTFGSSLLPQYWFTRLDEIRMLESSTASLHGREDKCRDTWLPWTAFTFMSQYTVLRSRFPPIEPNTWTCCSPQLPPPPLRGGGMGADDAAPSLYFHVDFNAPPFLFFYPFPFSLLFWPPRKGDKRGPPFVFVNLHKFKLGKIINCMEPVYVYCNVLE